MKGSLSFRPLPSQTSHHSVLMNHAGGESHVIYAGLVPKEVILNILSRAAEDSDTEELKVIAGNFGSL